MGEIRKLKCSLSPEQEQKIDEALKRREQIDSECFLKLLKLLPFVETGDSEIKRTVKEAEQLIRKRDQANHDFMAGLTGRS